MALKLNGKDDRLRRADFRALASTAGVRAADADAAIDETIQQITRAIDGIALPNLPNAATETSAMTAEMIKIIRRTRVESL